MMKNFLYINPNPKSYFSVSLLNSYNPINKPNSNFEHVMGIEYMLLF